MRSNSSRNQVRRELFGKSLAFYRQYPDIFARDRLKIPLNLYQKILLRAFFRNKYSMWILSRGLGKSWLGALALCCFGILYRNTLMGVVAPSFRQSKIIIEDKVIRDLCKRSPFLQNEIKRVVLSQAEASIEFYNGSRIRAIPTGDGNKIRGERFQLIMADEYAQIRPEIIDLVIQPMLNVVADYQVGKKQEDYANALGNRLLITSSAYYRHNHLYPLFLLYAKEMATGEGKYFVATLSYQIGVQVGLFDADHIEKEKKRLSAMDFRMEYECIFPNLAEDAWISPNDLTACSTLVHIETKGEPEFEYVMGLDCARVEGGDNTVAHIIKLVPRKDHIEKQVVYTLSMNGLSFKEQAAQIRAVMKKFPVIVVAMDTSGLGVGLADELANEYWDIELQRNLPPIIDINDVEAIARITNGIPLIHGVKPNNEMNHHMGMLIKTATQKKHVRFYSPDAGDDKIATQTADMSTSSLLTTEEEKQNLEAEALRRECMAISAKPNGVFFKFESKTRKDRFSALGFGLLAAEKREEQLQDNSHSLMVGAVTRR